MKFVKEFVVPAAVLTTICVVVSGALVLTYETTKPIIEAAKIAKADEARIQVLAGADSFTQVADLALEGVVDAYTANNGAGYVITGVANGYGGPVEVMVGIKADGTIDTAKLLNHSETSGIGTKVGEEAYTSQYTGKDISLTGVDAVSGATVSSGAFKASVENAFTAYAQVAGVEVAPKGGPETVIYPDATFEEVSAEGAKKVLKSGDDYVIVIETTGYADGMNVYTGITGGKIVGVGLGESNETPGFGSKTGEEPYIGQYVGKTSADGVDMVAGATMSSNAFAGAVNKAMEIYTTNFGGGEIAEEPKAEEVEVVEPAFLHIVTVTGYNPSIPMNVTVSFDSEGKIIAMDANVDGETVGLGSQYGEDDYVSKWLGLTAGTVDTISGATVTGNAINAAVAEAFTAFNAQKGA